MRVGQRVVRGRGKRVLIDGNANANGTHACDDREEIARVAYELYLRRGSEHGHDLEDWLQAEQAVRQS